MGDKFNPEFFQKTHKLQYQLQILIEDYYIIKLIIYFDKRFINIYGRILIK